MPPADSGWQIWEGGKIDLPVSPSLGTRAGAMPEASGDSSSGTFAEKMTSPWTAIVLGILALLLGCASGQKWTTTDGGHTYENSRGGAFVYSPRTSHPITERITLNRNSPVSPHLREWRLHSITPDGTTTLKFTEKGTSTLITAAIGTTFPQFGDMTMTLLYASYTEGTARIEVSYGN